jgi:hypothetical protein
MDKADIRPFLYRVATDPVYRAQLESDPVGTMAALGVSLDPAKDLPPNGIIALPSNQDILDNLDSLANQFESLACAMWDLCLLWLRP